MGNSQHIGGHKAGTTGKLNAILQPFIIYVNRYIIDISAIDWYNHAVIVHARPDSLEEGIK
jgi:hypothetical protein